MQHEPAVVMIGRLDRCLSAPSILVVFVFLRFLVNVLGGVSNTRVPVGVSIQRQQKRKAGLTSYRAQILSVMKRSTAGMNTPAS